jgi:hypothetical protein
MVGCERESGDDEHIQYIGAQPFARWWIIELHISEFILRAGSLHCMTNNVMASLPGIGKICAWSCNRQSSIAQP